MKPSINSTGLSGAKLERMDEMLIAMLSDNSA
jgi:hypothetical protein